jgi:hypothetical protein
MLHIISKNGGGGREVFEALEALEALALPALPHICL